MNTRQVPVEPTEEMVDAAWGLRGGYRIYKAMIAAAAEPSEVERLAVEVADNVLMLVEHILEQHEGTRTALEASEAEAKKLQALFNARSQLTRLAQYDDKLSAVMPSDYKDWHENSRSEWPEVAAHAITNLRKQRDQAENELEINRAKVAGLEAANEQLQTNSRDFWKLQTKAAESQLTALQKNHDRWEKTAKDERRRCNLLNEELTALREGLEGLIEVWGGSIGWGTTWQTTRNKCAAELQSLLTQTTPPVNSAEAVVGGEDSDTARVVGVAMADRCTCVSCPHCGGTGREGYMLNGKFYDHHPMDDMAESVECENCRGEGVDDVCDYCQDHFEDGWEESAGVGCDNRSHPD